MPPVLRKLMRHANVQTTMQYYVDLDVDEMADDCVDSYPPTRGTVSVPGNISGNIAPESTENEESPTTVNDCEASSYVNEGDGMRPQPPDRQSGKF